MFAVSRSDSNSIAMLRAVEVLNSVGMEKKDSRQIHSETMLPVQPSYGRIPRGQKHSADCLGFVTEYQYLILAVDYSARLRLNSDRKRNF